MIPRNSQNIRPCHTFNHRIRCMYFSAKSVSSNKENKVQEMKRSGKERNEIFELLHWKNGWLG